MAVFLVSAALLVLACVGSYRLRDARCTVEQVCFTTEPYDPDPLPIQGWLIRPRGTGRERLPGVVFCHGLACNKEMYFRLCRRIASFGVAVLAIDLRGHGRSGGPSDFSRSEHYEIWAALDMLRAREDIDPGRLGLIGHSLGGIAVTRAVFMEPPIRIRSAVAIFCWEGIREAIEAVFGPLEVFVGRWWPFFGWSRQFSILDPKALAERSVLEHLSPHVPTDYQLIVGSRDPLTDTKRSEAILARAAGRERIDPGRVYGEPGTGSARRLITVRGADHITVLARRETFRAIHEWLQAGLDIPCSDQAPKGVGSKGETLFGSAALVLFVVSLLACFNWALGIWGIPLSPSPERLPSWPLSLGALVSFVLSSSLAIPLARALRLKPFVPHWGGDVLSLVMICRSALLVSLTVILLAVGLLPGGTWLERLVGTFPRALYGLGTAMVPFAWLVASWNVVAASNRLPRFWPVTGWSTFCTTLLAFLASCLAEEAVFRGILQSRLSCLGPVAEIVLAVLIYAVIGAIALVLSLWSLFPSPSYAATFRTLRVPLMPVVFAAALGALLVHGLVAAVLFHYTQTILAPAVFMAFVFSFLFSGPTGVRTY